MAVIAPTAEDPPDLLEVKIINEIRSAIESATRMHVEIYAGADETPAIYASDNIGGPWTKVANSVEDFLPEGDGGPWRRPLFAPNEFRQNRTGKSITIYNLGRASKVIVYVGDSVTAVAECKQSSRGIKIWKHRIACVWPWAALPDERLLCQKFDEMTTAFGVAKKQLIIDDAV